MVTVRVSLNLKFSLKQQMVASENGFELNEKEVI